MKKKKKKTQGADSLPLTYFKCTVCGKRSGAREEKPEKFCVEHYVQRRKYKA